MRYLKLLPVSLAMATIISALLTRDPTLAFFHNYGYLDWEKNKL